ncbi:hypothetical protein [Intestinibacter sp.]|uniref:hypothetical protein n=1 Tax=Intestinibacter sp. TaxID=1965304 RepID=UPI002A90D755|nr:hypothetical protein [Intestinibacter sp.]MDY5213262.1 hypothetical protein [Intestinibacter sp.]
MNLNKNKRKKFTYDGKKIIKVGAKELYPFVYKRIWDLTEYDKELLISYGLKKAKYIYVGSSNKYNLKVRCSNWKYEIENKRKNASKEIRAFIGKIKLFYELETSYTDEEVDYLLYYNAKIISRCESYNTMRKLEKYFTSQYHDLEFWGDILDKPYILLSKKDSNLKEVRTGAFKLLKVK